MSLTYGFKYFSDEYIGEVGGLLFFSIEDWMQTSSPAGMNSTTVFSAFVHEVLRDGFVDDGSAAGLFSPFLVTLLREGLLSFDGDLLLLLGDGVNDSIGFPKYFDDGDVGDLFDLD